MVMKSAGLMAEGRSLLNEREDGGSESQLIMAITQRGAIGRGLFFFFLKLFCPFLGYADEG